MDLSAVLQVISTAAVVGGLVFAGLELRASRRQRAHAAQALLLHSFEGPELTRSMKTIMSMPDGMSKADVEARGEEQDQLVWYWLGMMESIGMLVFEREIDLRLVFNVMGGSILITWRKLARFVADVRAERKNDSFNEWFQWLAERLATLEHDEDRRPAHIREADWKP